MEPDPLRETPQHDAAAESWVDEHGTHWHRGAEGYWWYWAGDHWQNWTPRWPAQAATADQQRKRRIIIWTASIWNGIALVFVVPTLVADPGTVGGWSIIGFFLLGDLIMFLAWPRRKRPARQD